MEMHRGDRTRAQRAPDGTPTHQRVTGGSQESTGAHESKLRLQQQHRLARHVRRAQRATLSFLACWARRPVSLHLASQVLGPTSSR